MAIKQIQSTGLDRFLTVLSATPDGIGWDVMARTAECLAFLQRKPDQAAFVSHDAADADVARNMGLAWYGAAWVPGADPCTEPLALPGELARLLGQG